MTFEDSWNTWNGLPRKLTPEQIEHVGVFIDALESIRHNHSHREDKEEFLGRLRNGDPVALYFVRPSAEQSYVRVIISSYGGFHVEVESERFPGDYAEQLHEIADRHGIRAYVPNVEFDHCIPGVDPEPPRYFSVVCIPMFRQDGTQLTLDELVTLHMHPVSMAIKDARELIEHHEIAKKEGQR